MDRKKKQKSKIKMQNDSVKFKKYGDFWATEVTEDPEILFLTTDSYFGFTGAGGSPHQGPVVWV